MRRVNIEFDGGPWDGEQRDDVTPVSVFRGVKQHLDGSFLQYTYEPVHYYTAAGRLIYRLVNITPTTHPSSRAVDQ